MFYRSLMGPGRKFCYVSATAEHIELAITTADKSRQFRVIRIDHRLLSDRHAVQLDSLRTMADVLAERRQRAYDTYSDRFWLQRGHSWPKLLKSLDFAYAKKTSSIEDGVYNQGELLDLFRDLKAGLDGDLIVISD